MLISITGIHKIIKMPYQVVKPRKPSKAKPKPLTDVQLRIVDEILSGFEIRVFPDETNKYWIYDPVNDIREYDIQERTLNILKDKDLVKLRNDPDEDGFERWY